MEFHLLPGSHPSEPVQTGAHRFGDWLTVAEAVAYCTDQGLTRTAKTVRKWAARAARDPDNPEITVRREDLDNGFRWTIERVSLDRKIAEEIEFEARRESEPVRTGAHPSGEVQTGSGEETRDEPDAHLSKPVRTGSHPSEPVRDKENLIDELRERIDDLKGEVAFYRDELTDRRQTTTALTDVIESFRLTAASNAEQRSRGDRRSDYGSSFPVGDKPASEDRSDEV